MISRAPNQASAPANRPRTLAGRIRGSFLSSVGSIVFGMEDGTQISGESRVPSC